MKHKLFFISALFLLQSLNAQWAGSTSDGGSERVQVKQNTKNNTSEKRGRLTLGLGIGGYAQDLCEASLPISPDYGSGFITSYTSNPDPTGFNVFMNGMQKTGYRNLWVGFEWGLGYAGKTVEYEYYTS